jgi:hypothetical protein
VKLIARVMAVIVPLALLVTGNTELAVIFVAAGGLAALGALQQRRYTVEVEVAMSGASYGLPGDADLRSAAAAHVAHVAHVLTGARADDVGRSVGLPV